MKGTKLLFLLVIFLAIAPAFALHNSTFSTLPSFAYISEPKNFNFTASSTGDQIEYFSLDLSSLQGGYGVVSCSPGWSLNQSGNLLRCNGGTGSSVTISVNNLYSSTHASFGAETGDVNNSTFSGQATIDIYSAKLNFTNLATFEGKYANSNNSNHGQKKTYYLLFQNTGTDNATWVNGTLSNFTIDEVLSPQSIIVGQETYQGLSCSHNLTSVSCQVTPDAQAKFAIVLNATAPSTTLSSNFTLTTYFQRGANTSDWFTLSSQSPASIVAVMTSGNGSRIDSGPRAFSANFTNLGEGSADNFVSIIQLSSCGTTSYKVAEENYTSVPGGNSENYSLSYLVPDISRNCTMNFTYLYTESNTGKANYTSWLSPIEVVEFSFNKSSYPQYFQSASTENITINFTNTGDSTINSVTVVSQNLTFNTVWASSGSCQINSSNQLHCNGTYSAGPYDLLINATAPLMGGVDNFTLFFFGSNGGVKEESASFIIQSPATFLNLTPAYLNTTRVGTGKSYAVMKVNFTHGDVGVGVNDIEVREIPIRIEDNTSSLLQAGVVNRVRISGATTYADANISSSNPTINLTSPLRISTNSTSEVTITFYISENATSDTVKLVFPSLSIPAYDSVTGSNVSINAAGSFTSNVTEIAEVPKLDAAIVTGLPSKLYRGTTGVSMSFEVENEGDILAEQVVLSISIKDSGGTTISATNVTPQQAIIEGGNKTTYTVIFNVPSTAKLGTMSVEITASGKDELYSDTYTSNKVSTTSKIESEVYLEVPSSIVSVPANGGSVSITVRNDGPITVGDIGIEVTGDCCTLSLDTVSLSLSSSSRQIVTISIEPKETAEKGDVETIGLVLKVGGETVSTYTFSIEVIESTASCAKLTESCSASMPCCEGQGTCVQGTCSDTVATIQRKSTAETAIRNAESQMENAEEVIEAARSKGIDVTEARLKLNEAKAALDQAKSKFEFGDYENANILASQSIQLSLDSQNLVPSSPEGDDILLVAGIFFVFILLAAGIGIYMTSSKKTLPSTSAGVSSVPQPNAQAPRPNSYYMQRQTGTGNYGQFYRNAPQYASAPPKGQASWTPQQRAAYYRRWQQYRNYYYSRMRQQGQVKK